MECVGMIEWKKNWNGEITEILRNECIEMIGRIGMDRNEQNGYEWVGFTLELTEVCRNDRMKIHVEWIGMSQNVTDDKWDDFQ